MAESTYQLDFHDDPAAFLAAAESYLASVPMATNVISSVADRQRRYGPSEHAPFCWYVVVRDGSTVVGAAMRTAPFAPYPLFVGPMADDAARSIARALHERGEDPGGANGALPAARVFAEESARLAGGRVRLEMDTRLWELGELRLPAPVPGRARLARPADSALCLAWFQDFRRAADAQSGRTTGHPEEHHTLEEILARISEGLILLWEAPDGEVAHLTGMVAPMAGVARIGPVYTPEHHRGRGYASATVAEASRRLAESGVAVTLFTDIENPVSNHVYAALGYRPVVDMANHSILATGEGTADVLTDRVTH